MCVGLWECSAWISGRWWWLKTAELLEMAPGMSLLNDVDSTKTPRRWALMTRFESDSSATLLGGSGLHDFSELSRRSCPEAAP